MIQDAIFILGQARSGTTLLQRALNSRAEVLISGEHLGLLAEISRSYHNFFAADIIRNFCDDSPRDEDRIRVEQALRNSAVFDPHRNGLSVDYVKSGFAAFVHLIGNPSKCALRWGFKEIRYGYGNDFVVPMILELFPQAKIILLLRHPVEQIWSKQRTGWWPETMQQNVEAWISQTRSFQQYAVKHERNAKIIRYEEMIDRKTSCLSTLFDWLELPFEGRQKEIAFSEVRVGATPNRGEPPEEVREMIENKCLLDEFSSLYRAGRLHSGGTCLSSRDKTRLNKSVKSLNWILRRLPSRQRNKFPSYMRSLPKQARRALIQRKIIERRDNSGKMDYALAVARGFVQDPFILFWRPYFSLALGLLLSRKMRERLRGGNRLA